MQAEHIASEVGPREIGSPMAFEVDRSTGRLIGASRHYEKYVRDLAGLYLDEAAFASRCAVHGDDVAYFVDDFRANEEEGLIVGTSVLLPGVIGSEYAMTRGHLHEHAAAPEIYHCLSGHGALVMENLKGEPRIVEMRESTVVYVPGHWIHRSVNVGGDPLVTMFAYSSGAGQDYGVVERSRGLSKLVVRDGEGWRVVDNPRYVARDAASLPM